MESPFRKEFAAEYGNLMFLNAEIAQKAHVKRLVIGHYSARYEDMAPLKKEADKIFPGTILGEEGMRLSV